MNVPPSLARVAGVDFCGCPDLCARSEGTTPDAATRAATQAHPRHAGFLFAGPFRFRYPAGMDLIRCELLSPAPDESLDAVKAILRAYNRSNNPVFFANRELPENAPRALHIIVFDDGGKVIAGLIGDTSYKWLHVEYLAVHSDHRRRGLGSRLIRMAEAEAVQRNCRYSFLDTMSYQARDFYVKLGYRVAGSLEDWDSHGHTKYLMTKDLA
jgi:ribosomal protein S18 acetylase RimI-like enzyme